MSIFRELQRRNVFRVAGAYAVIGWLVAEVGALAFGTFEAPAWVMKVFATFILLGFPFALFFAWAFELTPEGLKREKDVDRSQSITHFPHNGRLETPADVTVTGAKVVGELLTDRVYSS